MTEQIVTTTPMNAPNTIKDWWNAASFEGKEYCEMKEDGTLLLKPTPKHPERTIFNLTPDNADFAIKALQEKYPEVQAKVKELDNEWAAADDKLKLVGKISRVKEYLKHASAIGDFNVLDESIAEKEILLQQLIDEHYSQRLQIVEHAEKQAKASQEWKETTQLFKEVGEQWKNVGFVDKHRNDELWQRLETAKQQFFDRKRQHHEDQEREMLQNLDLKIELVDKAEANHNSDDWKNVTELYKNLMEEWKTIGRTPHDKNEELWHRFITAKNHFFERKKGHFEDIQKEQLANYEVKLALVEKAEQLKESEDWNTTAQAYADIMEEWKNTGRVPAEKSDELWNRMSEAKDHFFNAKRAHHETVKVSLEDNLAQKLALLKRAETIKNSNNWRTATEEMNELMNEWKKIGAVPREQSNNIWESFISARKYFFERKDADREKRKENAAKHAARRIEQKKVFLDKLQTELDEEQVRLDDFKNAVENITPGNKEEELRAHLTKLISQSEHKIAQKTKKIAEVQKEYDTIMSEENIAEEKKA